MSLKRSTKATCLALAALFAFSAIAASAVQAKAPRWTVNGVTIGAAVSKPFTGVSTGSEAGTANGKLEVPGLFTLTNPANKCTVTGNVVGSAALASGTVNNVKLQCHEIHMEGLPKCVLEDTTDNTPGTVTTNLLHGVTRWLSATPAANEPVGVTFTPTNGPFAELKITHKNPVEGGCIFNGLVVKIEGSVVAKAETPYTDKVTQALEFPNPPITKVWDPNTPVPRVETTDGLFVGGKAAAFTNTFDITLTSGESWGVEGG